MGGNLCGGGCVTKKEKEEWRGNEGKNGGLATQRNGKPKKIGPTTAMCGYSVRRGKWQWVFGENKNPKKKKGRKKSRGSDHLGVM